MRRQCLAIALSALLLAVVGPRGVCAAAAEVIALVEERQVPQADGKTVQYFVRLRNTGAVPVRGLRVTVELQDYFGKLLWARTASTMPGAIEPGETAMLSVTAPHLRDYNRTRYRFHYRPLSGR
jgi:hypothetical protein